MFDFESYHRATGIADATALLAQHPQARLLAGGTDVLINCIIIMPAIATWWIFTVWRHCAVLK